MTFVNEQKEINKDTEDILHWAETNALPVEHLKEEALQDPVLSRISDRIKRNRWSNCSQAERPYKEVRYKLTVEKVVICNEDLIVPPQRMRSEVIKNVHDDIHSHGGITATQKRLKLEAWCPGYLRDRTVHKNA